MYFLERAGAIVYVGSSDYPSYRVWQHTQCPWKKFDAAFYLPTDDAELPATEAHWIRTIRPAHNRNHNPESYRVTEAWGDTSSRRIRGPRPWRAERGKTVWVCRTLHVALAQLAVFRGGTASDVLHELLMPMLPKLNDEILIGVERLRDGKLD